MQLGKFDGRAYETLLQRAQEDLDLNAGGEDERKKMCVSFFGTGARVELMRLGAGTRTVSSRFWRGVRGCRRCRWSVRVRNGWIRIGDGFSFLFFKSPNVWALPHGLQPG